MIPSNGVVDVPDEGLPCDFGKYRLEKRIATGGMAEIFLARRRDDQGGPLVIKRILPHLVKSGEFVSMFLDEARIAAQLKHVNIVEIFDVGQIDFGEEQATATVRVTYHAYSMRSMLEREIKETQRWERVGKGNEWYVRPELEGLVGQVKDLL